jgi:uncharacterized protein YyaL (SSP411 family)
MAQAYLDAYRLTGNKEFALVGREILDYVSSPIMMNKEGGFFSAEDAGIFSFQLLLSI